MKTIYIMSHPAGHSAHTLFYKNPGTTGGTLGKDVEKAAKSASRH